MMDTNAEKRPFARLLQPLPASEDKQPLPIEADVDRLLAAVMEKAGVTEAYYEEHIGQFERTDEPARFLGRKSHLLSLALYISNVLTDGQRQPLKSRAWY